MSRNGYGKMLLAGTAALGLLVGESRRPEAAFVWTMVEVGPDVVVTGSGSLDLTGLNFLLPGFNGLMGIVPEDAFLIAFGNMPLGIYDVYGGYTGPTSFGPGGLTEASSASGDALLIGGWVNQVAVPQGYVSGTPLSTSMTFANHTFASLGVTPGTYVWMWASDSLTLNIVTSAVVPEPASALLVGIGLLGLAVACRRHV